MYKYLSLLIALFAFSLTVCSQNRNEEVKKSTDPLKFTDFKKFEVPEGIQSLCEPVYNNGCDMGDGFTDFAVEEIENYGSGCEDLNGTGWSQYLGLGPAILLPGFTHDFIMQTGYNDQLVTIWVHFDDDEVFEEDEIILFDFDMEQAGQFYTAQVDIPEDATPGLHYMRARTNWQNSCDDPCEAYGYGEAEDYYVLIGASESGAVEGWVTELDGGAPVEAATITLEGLISYSTTTSSDGFYSIDFVFVGDYELSCEKTGYNIQSANVTIEEDITLEMDFELTHPVMVVDPLFINVNVPQGGSTEESIQVENQGNGVLNWAASVQISGDKSKDPFDLQYQYAVEEGNGEAGIETDGNFIYTTKWNSGEILKYDLSGNYIESLSITVAARDLAYNGTYFYGSAATTTVYEMDFENETIVSTFTAPTMVRAIAYNDGEEVFYANNYSSPIVKFDLAGAILGEFDCGPIGENYYGFAYDAASAGGPFLWGYAQTGESQNEIIQIQLPSGTETGFSLDVKDKLSGPVFNMAGGLFTQPNLIFGKWTLGGLIQNEWMWGLELADAQTWVWVEPNTGILDPSNSIEPIVHFDAEELEPGTYSAQVLFSSYPEVGTPVIEVTMNVGETLYQPCDLLHEVSCTDVELSWSVCPAGSPQPDSFFVYRNNDFVDVCEENNYTVVLSLPEMEYTFKVTAFYNGIESNPSEEAEVWIPMPEDLEPTNLHVSTAGGVITLIFDPPQGCVGPVQYNLYRDGTLYMTGVDPQFQVEGGYYTYYVTAVYYFGESQSSNEVLFTALSENTHDRFEVFPNPASKFIGIDTGGTIDYIRVTNFRGVEVYSALANNTFTGIDVSDWASGIYVIRVGIDGTDYARKVIVQ